MTEPGYVATGLAVAVAITFALRAVPFAVKSAVKESALLNDLGRWMPLGAVAVLAVYCLASTDASAPTYGLPEVAGVAVTVAVHLWRRNAVLSILAGTAVCLVLTNVVLTG